MRQTSSKSWPSSYLCPVSRARPPLSTAIRQSRPRTPLAVGTARQPSPIHRLGTNAQAVVIALQRQVFPAPPMAQLDERAELLRPVARHSAADRKDSKAFFLEQRRRKIFQILKRIESKTRLAFFVALAVCQCVVQTEFGIRECRHEHWNVLLVCGLQYSALSFRMLG